MKYIIKQISTLLLLVFVFTACQQEIDEYFYKETADEFVDTDVLSLLKKEARFSSFVAFIEELHADTIINNGNSFTLFVPDNNAFDNLDPAILKDDLFNYLVTESYVNLNQLDQSTLLQSYGGKFVSLEVLGDSAFKYDGIEVIKGSPLTNNGRYYELADMVRPRLNMYEYFARNNPFFSAYYNNLDSVFLDLELSTPLSFNDSGQTVYDTVFSTINKFEEEYFRISEEFRSVKATMLVFSEDQFNAALDSLYNQLGISAIPEIWKNDVLMPYVLDRSIFRNALNYDAFLPGRVMNIIGDSVDVEPVKIDPNYFDCSNGRVYNYSEFTVPEELYKVSDTVYLAQRLNLISLSTKPNATKSDHTYGWGSEFEITGKRFVPQVSGEGGLIVDMGSPDYSGEFSLTYKHYNVFPGKYRLRMKVNALNNIGIWKLYVNDQQLPFKQYPYHTLESFWDWDFDFYDLRSGFISPYPSAYSSDNSYYTYDGKTCIFEVLAGYIDGSSDALLVDEFGDVEVRLEYVGRSPKSSRNAGFNIEFATLEYYEE